MPRLKSHLYILINQQMNKVHEQHRLIFVSFYYGTNK